MAARGLIHSNVTIVAIKDALNGLINEKAHQLIAQYFRILKVTEIPDYKILTERLVAHARRHLDQHYSEGCHQLTINEQRVLAGATSPGVHLQGDFQNMLNWVEPQIRILVAELEKAASHRPLPAVAMSENISSHGQSGGITAHTVNIGPQSPSSPPEKPKSKWKKVIAVLVAMVAFIASFVKILDYFDVKPTSEPKAEKKVESKKEASPAMNPPQNTNVTSYNQSGGITAHTVNVGAIDRHLTPAQIQAIIGAAGPFLPSDVEVPITAALGNQEAQRLASEFVSAIRQAGRKADLLLPTPGLRPDVVGLIIGVRDQNSIHPTAIALGKVLSQANINVQYSLLEPSFFPDNQFVFVIGASK